MAQRPTIKVTSEMVFRAVAQRFAEPLAAFYGVPVKDLSNAQIATWMTQVPAGRDLLARVEQ